MAREYPPYPKWFGRGFAGLESASLLSPVLDGVLRASGWRERDAALATVCRHAAEMHNALGVTPSLPCAPTPFFGRPFMVIHGERFADALRNAITDPCVRALANRPLIGNIDLISDNTDFLEDSVRQDALRGLFSSEE